MLNQDATTQPASKEEGPHVVDVAVGAAVRRRRRALGISQTALGEGLGITFQQVQKYERGANRISASKLYEIGKELGVPVSYFFDALEQTDKPALSEHELILAELMATDAGVDLATALLGATPKEVRFLASMAEGVCRLRGQG
jgi:transcriptional regulator with XRE-family HTH domain